MKIYPTINACNKVLNKSFSQLHENVSNKYFESLLQNFNFSKYDRDSIINKIISNYKQPNRGYHGIKHILDMLQSFDMFLYESNQHIQIKNPNEFRFAILMHDYINGEADEVEKSKLKAKEFLHKISPIYNTSYVEALIQATDYSKNQHLTFDQQLMQDIDVEILGKTPEEYIRYSKEIRAQYSNYSDEIYNPARIKVLKSFLNKNSIYNTEYYKNKYETSARINIEREIEALEKQVEQA